MTLESELKRKVPMNEHLSEIREALLECPAIARITYHNLQNPDIREGQTVCLALELCPLYSSGTSLQESTLIKNTGEKDAILNSRVGNKWTATLRTIETMQTLLSTFKCPLKIKATYADIGVLAASTEAADAKAVVEHGNLYQRRLSDFCSERSILLSFSNLSDYENSVTDELKKVPSFLIPDLRWILYPEFRNLPHLVRILRMQNEIPLGSKGQRSKASVLMHTLENCGWYVNIWKGLMYQYLIYLEEIVSDVDIYLGMERTDSLLALQQLRPNSNLAKKTDDKCISKIIMPKYQTELVRIGKISGVLYKVSERKTRTLVIYGIGAPLPPDSGNLPDAPYILNYNIDLLVPDYIGYGRSAGKFTPANCIRTFLHLYNHLTKGCVAKSGYKNLEIKLKYRDVIFIGRSFGGTYMPLLPKYNPKINKLCLIYPVLDYTRCGKIKGEETVESFMKAMRLDGYKYLYRGIIDKKWAKHFKNQDSLSPIKNLKYLSNCKLFIGHGIKDKNIHYSNSVRYYQKLLKMHAGKKDQYVLKLYKTGNHSSKTSNKAVVDFLNWLKVKSTS